MSEQRPPLLSAQNLARAFRVGSQTVDALRGVNIEIQQGDFIAIAGPSGSGKSTLLHLLGLIDSPTEGEVRVRGSAAQALGLERRAALRLNTLGFVFQAFNLLQMLTARQNVEIALALAGRRTPRTALPCRGSAQRGRPWPAPQPSPGPALRRRAPARRDRARPRQQSRCRPRRRAHREPRFADRSRDRRPARTAQRRRPDHRDGHPQPRNRAPRPSPVPHARRGDRRGGPSHAGRRGIPQRSGGLICPCDT